MPDALTISDVAGMFVAIPPDVLPWKYIVPDPPLVAVIVVLPQNVPLPDAATVVGSVFAVTLTVAMQPVGRV